MATAHDTVWVNPFSKDRRKAANHAARRGRKKYGQAIRLWALLIGLV